MRTYGVQSSNLCIWEGLRRLLVEIKGKRFLEEQQKLYLLMDVEDIERWRLAIRRVEKFHGVESKSNKCGPIKGNSIQTTLFSIQKQ